MADNTNDDTRCEAGGCGRVLEDNDETIVILAGVWKKKNGFKEKRRWAILHRSCFNLSISSPDATMEEIRRLTEEA